MVDIGRSVYLVRRASAVADGAVYRGGTYGNSAYLYVSRRRSAPDGQSGLGDGTCGDRLGAIGVPGKMDAQHSDRRTDYVERLLGRACGAPRNSRPACRNTGGGARAFRTDPTHGGATYTCRSLLLGRDRRNGSPDAYRRDKAVRNTRTNDAVFVASSSYGARRGKNRACYATRPNPVAFCKISGR